MLKILPFLVVFIFTISLTQAALPNCEAGVTCPTGGIWSEWSTTETCTQPCGACAQVYETRTCLTASVSCACVGDSSRYAPCNTQACAYPAQKTCCVPRVLGRFNGKTQCGPLPRNETQTSCCPVGGIWSAWSLFTRIDSTWKRTRECLSEAAGCPCDGSTEEAGSANAGGCPCDPPTGTNQCTPHPAYYHPKFEIDSETCYAKALFAAKNPNDTTHICGKLSATQSETKGLFGYTKLNGVCDFKQPFPCFDSDSVYLTFTCDLTGGNWIMDYFNLPILAYNQFTFAESTWNY